MGIFNPNAFNNEDYDNIVEAAEGYDDGVYSAQLAQIVGLQNSLALFEAGIKTDIYENVMVNEGVNEDEVMAFSEGAIGDMLKKIKDFFIKLWAKIKAIFKGFMARLEAKFGKNNKEFINKYKKDVIGKDLTDFEVTYRKKKDSPKLIDFNSLETKATGAGLRLNTIGWFSKKDEWKTYNENFDSEDCKEKLLGSFIDQKSGVAEKEFEKEAFDAYFEDEESNEVTTGDISTIMTEMMTFKQTRKDLKKENDDLNKAIAQVIKEIDKASNENYRLAPAKEGDTTKGKSINTITFGKNRSEANVKFDNHTIGSDQSERNENISLLQAAIGAVSRSANIVQSCVLKATAVSLKIKDFENKQNRMIFAKAVAYKRKEESTIMENAMAELAEWEADI